jgi:hypothetical protein
MWESNGSREIDLLRRQGVFSQRPAAIAIYECSKSGVRNHFRSLKPAKHEPIELKIFPAYMSNNVYPRGPGNECPHGDLPPSCHQHP